MRPRQRQPIVLQCRTDNVRFAINIGDGTFRGQAKAGDLFVVPPHATTHFIIHDDHKLLAMALPLTMPDIPTDEIQSFEEQIAPLRRRSVRNIVISGMIDRLWELGAADARASAYARAAATIIIAELANEASAGVPSARGGLSPRIAARACEFMTANIARRVATEEVAQAVGMSTFHFTREFGRSLGCSPQAWLARHRIEVAKDVIRREPETSLSEIAGRVGYQSQSSFGAVFAKVTGISPARFRRTCH